MRKALTGTALLLSLIGTTALAQSSGVPREFPPEDFRGNQFVDSEGCAFIRAGISGNTNWVPRVDASRTQLCNFQPTFAAAEPEAAAAENVIAEAEETVVPNAPVETVAADEPAAEDLPLIIFPSAAEVAASNRPVTVPVPSRTPAAPTPRVIAAATAPEPEVTPAPEPAQITRAEVCDGKFGPQPGFISSTTGETLDCGPAPVVAAAPEPEPVAAPEPLRMTMAEICEAAAVGDRKFVNANTGEAIVCPSPVQVARVATPTVAPAEPAPVQAPAPQIANACPEIPAGPGQTVRCGPQTDRPWTAAGSDGRSSRAKSPFAGLGRSVVPASNPAANVAAAQPRVPSGFQRVFNDGRHNTQRGLPAVQATQAAAIRVPAATPYRYIQVGSFGVPSNAENLLARLASMGLGTASGSSRGLKIVAVGPFTNAVDMQRALGQVRALGFPDAFPRN